MTTTPSFTMGIEEEYLLVDARTLDLVEAPDALMRECRDRLGEKVAAEFLRCQIEVATGVCATVGEAGRDLAGLRRAVKEICEGHGIAPIAASTHPFSKWDEQAFTDKRRYRDLEHDLEGVARRMLICGMHVHVGIEDDDLRIALMNRFRSVLPHLLALSTSSPFWEGRETGLHSYRLTVFDNLPRTGLPPRFASHAEYARMVRTIVGSGAIEDATKIWWDLRPSGRYPTLECRICDVMPRMADTLAVAALIQSLMRMLHEAGREDAPWPADDRVLIEENRWRAQRYGLDGGLIDWERGRVVPAAETFERLLALAAPHAEALGCAAELGGVRDILGEGTSAHRQIAVYREAREQGEDEAAALKAVTRSLVSEFGEAGLDEEG